MPAVQRLQQIAFHQMPATAHVDQRRTPGQLPEQLAIENTLGLFGQRQHAQQDVALAEEGRQLRIARITRHARYLVGAAGPAR
ncbi:hypothetical protein D3C86_1386610 [compost metagenome]